MQCMYLNNFPTKHEHIMDTRYEYEKTGACIALQ